MKLAVLADVHANFVALQTVAAHIEAWQADLVVVAGDIVNRGPRPLECLRFVQDKQHTPGWLVVRGNHEDYILSHTSTGIPRSGLEFEVHRHSYWTYQQLDGNIPALKAMPFQQNLSAPDGSEVCVTHASMLGNRDGIYPGMADGELRQKIQPYAALFCVGHTHWPLVRRIDDTLVVNAGSAGLPFDGDRRTGYAQLSWQRGQWQSQIVRLDYDHQKAERDFSNLDFLEGSGPLGQVILNELLTAQSRLFYWTYQYQARVLAGELTMAESVERFLAEL